MTRERSALPVLAVLMGYWGYLDAINAVAAPLLARDFGLDDRSIPATFGWMAVGAFASLPLARAADRLGRRRVLLACVVALAPATALSAAAPTLNSFIAAQIFLQGLKGVLMALIPVMVAESLPTQRRAAGHGRVGLGGALGSGAALLLVTTSGEMGGSWRWAWAAAALGIAVVPFALRSLPESQHFTRAEAAGETLHSKARELVSARYLRRTVAALTAAAFYPMATAGTQGWLFYHPVQNLGIDAATVTALVMVGGSAGILGFFAGGRLSEAWGRRATFCGAGIVYLVSALGFYQVGPDFPPTPVLGLALAWSGMAFAGSTAIVPLRAAGTELFPTRLRGAIAGWMAIATAGAVVGVNFAVSWLAGTLGGIAPAASVAAFAMLIAMAAFVTLPETRGLELERAALEG